MKTLTKSEMKAANGIPANYTPTSMMTTPSGGRVVGWSVRGKFAGRQTSGVATLFVETQRELHPSFFAHVS